MREDSEEYKSKKKFFSKLLTIYGRKPVLEALQDPKVRAYKLHLAETNKPAALLNEIIALAEKKSAQIEYHSRAALSRISKNSKQDQGIALDIECQGFHWLEDLIDSPPQSAQLIALDNITNPQNLGMIVRSVCASPITGLILPTKGCARLDSLVIKASAGTLFKANIYLCEHLDSALSELKDLSFDIFALEASGKEKLGEFTSPNRAVFVMGNETHGLSSSVKSQCNRGLQIPMCNGVESLNVSIAASLIAFSGLYRKN